jgi:hypothetical protein
VLKNEGRIVRVSAPSEPGHRRFRYHGRRVGEGVSQIVRVEATAQQAESSNRLRTHKRTIGRQRSPNAAQKRSRCCSNELLFVSFDRCGIWNQEGKEGLSVGSGHLIHKFFCRHVAGKTAEEQRPPGIMQITAVLRPGSVTDVKYQGHARRPDGEHPKEQHRHDDKEENVRRLLYDSRQIQAIH